MKEYFTDDKKLHIIGKIKEKTGRDALECRELVYTRHPVFSLKMLMEMNMVLFNNKTSNRFFAFRFSKGGRAMSIIHFPL